MGKSKSKRIDTKKDDFAKKSELATSSFSPDLSAVVPAAKAPLREAGDGATDGKRSAVGKSAGSVVGGAGKSVNPNGSADMETDTVNGNKILRLECNPNWTFEERIQACKKAGARGKLEFWCDEPFDIDLDLYDDSGKLITADDDEFVARVVEGAEDEPHTATENDDTDVEIADDEDSDGDDTVVEIHPGQRIKLGVKKGAPVIQKIVACIKAGIRGNVTFDGVAYDCRLIFESLSQLHATAAAKLAANGGNGSLMSVIEQELADLEQPVGIGALGSDGDKGDALTAPEPSIPAPDVPTLQPKSGKAVPVAKTNSIGTIVTTAAGDTPKPAAKSWAAIVSSNRTPDEDVLELDSELTELDDDDTLPMDDDDCIEENVEKLRLVGVFSTKFPGRAAVQKMVDSWPRYCNYHYHNSGWIIFCFKSENDALEVLQRGPYKPYGIPLTLKRMPQFFNFSKEDHSVVPVWIQLPNLPLRFWSKKALSKICTQVGKPLHTDKMTASINAPSFARCLVDVDLSKPRRAFLNIKPPRGKKFRQAILYEESPPYCAGCKRLGHLEKNCKGVDQYIAPLYVSKAQKAKAAVTEAPGKNNKGKTSITGTASGANSGTDRGSGKAAGHDSGAAVGKTGSAGHVSGAAVGKSGAAVGTSGAAVGTTGAAVGTSGAVMAQAVAAVAQAVAVMAQAGAEKVDAGAVGEWTVVRGKKGNKNDGAEHDVSGTQPGLKTPDKGVVKTGLMTPGTYDDPTGPKGPPPSKKKKNKNKNKKRKDHG